MKQNPERQAEAGRQESIPEAAPVIRELRHALRDREDAGQGVNASYHLSPSLATLLYVWVAGGGGRSGVEEERVNRVLGLGRRMANIIRPLVEDRFLSQSGDLLGPGPELNAAPAQPPVLRWEDVFPSFRGQYARIATLWYLAGVVPLTGGTDWVWQETMQEKLGLSERTIRRTLKALEDEDYLRRSPRRKRDRATHLSWGPVALPGGEDRTPAPSPVVIRSPRPTPPSQEPTGYSESQPPPREAVNREERPLPGEEKRDPGDPKDAGIDVIHVGTRAIEIGPDVPIRIERAEDGRLVHRIGGMRIVLPPEA